MKNRADWRVTKARKRVRKHQVAEGSCYGIDIILYILISYHRKIKLYRGLASNTDYIM